MPDSFAWRCPFCQHMTTLNRDRWSIEDHDFGLVNRHGHKVVRSVVFCCPNPDCREFTLVVSLHPYAPIPGGGGWKAGEAERTWNLVPEANIKVFPDYVPVPIVNDYKEACLVLAHSPKASATLARRALQGMIRDFWGISRGRLIDEIDALKERVDPTSWAAIDAVRKLGNIGAHMERDINLVIEVDPNEASLLIELIETLIQEWYVARQERAQRMAAVVAAAQAKTNP